MQLGCSVSEIKPSCNATASFSVNQTSVCEDDSLVFANTSANAFEYEWLMDGATVATSENIQIVFDSAKTYQVMLVINPNGCIDTAITTITVNPPPVVSISGNTSVCEGASTILTASGGTTYQWSTGDTASAITISPAVDTSYTVTAIDANGCENTSIANITVNPLAQAVFSFTQSGDTVNFSNSSINATTYAWDFGDGTLTSPVQDPIHIYSTDGNYIVMLIATNSCGSDTVLQTVTINTTGIQNSSHIGGIEIYPNPSGGKFQISILNSELRTQNSELEVFNVLGEKIHRQIIESPNQLIDLSTHPSGLYHLMLTNGEIYMRKKVVLK